MKKETDKYSFPSVLRIWSFPQGVFLESVFFKTEFLTSIAGRAAESVAAQQRRCELSKGLVSRARMLYVNSESNREPERVRASKREPERAGEQARERS